MTKRDKRLQRIRQNPKNVSFEELRQVIEDYGFILKRSSGSHHVFDMTVEDQIWTLVIPYNRPHVKPTYVKRAIDSIDELILLRNQDGDDDE
jgi:hypothetical protein